METQENDNKGAQNDLIQLIKEDFDGNNEIRFFISERGNQRIEVKDLDNGEIWQTLECTEPVEDMDDYDDISAAMLTMLFDQIGQVVDDYAILN